MAVRLRPLPHQQRRGVRPQPGRLALSNIKVLNTQKKTVLKAGHMVTTPPLLAAEDGVLSQSSMQPGYMVSAR